MSGIIGPAWDFSLRLKAILNCADLQKNRDIWRQAEIMEDSAEVSSIVMTQGTVRS